MDVKVQQSETGLFLVNYRVSTGLAGAPSLSLALSVDTIKRWVTGLGKVTQAVLHPDLVAAQVTGSYHEVSDVNGPNYVVSLDGYSPVVINNNGSPVIQAELTLVGGWDSGTATFSFRRGLYGPMTHITDAKVEKISQA